MGEDSTGTPSYDITDSVEISKDLTILTCIHAALSMLLHDSLQVCVTMDGFVFGGPEFNSSKLCK